MSKKNPVAIGFLQAAGVVVYCALVVWLMNFFEKAMPKTGNFSAGVLMLVLLVFSATVTGSLVFGYPVYLALNQKIKPALKVLLCTLLFCLLIFAIIIALVIL